MHAEQEVLHEILHSITRKWLPIHSVTKGIKYVVKTYVNHKIPEHLIMLQIKM